jgi:hypothetical protein
VSVKERERERVRDRGRERAREREGERSRQNLQHEVIDDYCMIDSDDAK